jgi:hypothetical protein
LFRASQSKGSSKTSLSDLFFVADFDEIGPFLGLGSEMGFNDRDLIGISHPVGTNSEQLFQLFQAVSTNILKLHGFPKNFNFRKYRHFLGNPQNGWIGQMSNFITVLFVNSPSCLRLLKF